MTRLYIIRHCEAQGNKLRLFQGSTDYDISTTGAKQLEFLGERFKDIHIDKIFSSPLKRAFKTAKIIADRKNLSVETVDGLREIDVGVLENQRFDKIFKEDPDLLDIWQNHPQDFAPENGENMRCTYKRIWETVYELAAKNTDKTIVAAAHGGVIRCLLCRFMYGDIEYLSHTPWSDNTAVSLIEFDADLKPSVVFSNDSSHLPESLLPIGSRIQTADREEA